MLSTDVPLLVGSVDLEKPSLLWAQLRLYRDRLTLTYWQGLTPETRQIPLQDINDVEQPAPDRLVLRRTDAPPLRIQVDPAARWRTAIMAHRDVEHDVPPEDDDT